MVWTRFLLEDDKGQRRQEEREESDVISSPAEDGQLQWTPRTDGESEGGG